MIGKLLAIVSILICASVIGGCSSHSNSQHRYSTNDSYSHDDFEDDDELDDVDDDFGGDDTSDAIIFTPLILFTFLNFYFETVVTE